MAVLKNQSQSILRQRSQSESTIEHEQMQGSRRSRSRSRSRSTSLRRRRSSSLLQSVENENDSSRRDSSSRRQEIPRYLEINTDDIDHSRDPGEFESIDWEEEGIELVLEEKEIYITSSKQLNRRGRGKPPRGMVRIERCIVILGADDFPLAKIRF